MKKKSLYTLTITLIFSLAALTPAAHAGSVQRQRWEGFAIGLGAAIIGSAILNQQRTGDYDRQPQVIYRPHRQQHSPNYHAPGPKRRDHGRGHWEVTKEWVPPTYKKVWNPGHYNRRGEWKSGHWIEIEDTPGYWAKTRIWMGRR